MARSSGRGLNWRAKISQEEFVAKFRELGPTRLARELGLSERNVAARRRRIEQSFGIEIEGPNKSQNLASVKQEEFTGRSNLEVVNGVVLVGGDSHNWPSQKAPVMHRALCHFLGVYRQERKLRAIVMNGDVTDFAIISRWPQVDWEKRPTVRDEVEICQERMGEIEQAAGKAPKFWPLGNHDARYSMYIAANAEKLEGIPGTQLKDHFPFWEPCWEVEINNGINTTTVKHTYKGGIHAPRNNALNAGCHFVTNHLHSAKVTPLTTKHNTFYGVDTGCLADVWGPQFRYLQGNPRDWRAAFAVLTYKDSTLLYPELVLGVDRDHVQFRGEIIKV